MKALTMHGPWDMLLIHGVKGCETRSRRTNMDPGTLVSIHAGKQCLAVDDMPWDLRDCVDDLSSEIDELYCDWPRGAVIGVVRYAWCLPTDGMDARTDTCDPLWWAQEDLSYGDEMACGDWSDGRYAWRMEPVVVFDEPVPARGRQGLWDWEAPAPIRGICRICGCSERYACPEGCGWADETQTLCTAIRCLEAVGDGD